MKMVSIVDLCRHLKIPLKREGRVFRTLSPFRPERNPSLVIYPETNSFYDFGSGEGGGVLFFIQKLYNVSREDARRMLQTLKLPEVKVNFHPRRTVHRESPDLSRIYNGRDFSLYFLLKGIPEPKGMYKVISYKGKLWIAFPLPNYHRMKGLELKRITETGHEYIPKERITIGRKLPWVVEKGSTWLVTESITDCLAGWKIISDDLSLFSLNGAGNTRWLSALVRFKKPQKLILALDNDLAGREATSKALDLLKNQGVTVEVFEEHTRKGVKDLYGLIG